MCFNIEYVSANCLEKWITFGTSHTVVIVCDFLRYSQKSSVFTPAVLQGDQMESRTLLIPYSNICFGHLDTKWSSLMRGVLKTN